MKKIGEDLYSINKNVKCIKCGCHGAVQSYGSYYLNGIDNIGEEGSLVYQLMKQYEHKPYMSHAMGFGGTIPWECLNCGNVGLIDFGGLEGYKLAFESMGEE